MEYRDIYSSLSSSVINPKKSGQGTQSAIINLFSLISLSFAFFFNLVLAHFNCNSTSGNSAIISDRGEKLSQYSGTLFLSGLIREDDSSVFKMAEYDGYNIYLSHIQKSEPLVSEFDNLLINSSILSFRPVSIDSESGKSSCNTGFNHKNTSGKYSESVHSDARITSGMIVGSIYRKANNLHLLPEAIHNKKMLNKDHRLSENQYRNTSLIDDPNIII